MNLLIDVGNTRIKWAIDEDDTWSTGSCRFAGARLEALWGGLAVPSTIIVASVVGSGFEREFRGWCQQRWALNPIFVRPSREQFGVCNHYADPAQLGADRWAALIGARRFTTNAVLVVDCGTAVTIDALTAEGDFLGGVIFPGIELARGALHQATHGIGQQEAHRLELFGRSTAAAVGAGVAYSVAGGIDRIVDEFARHIAPPVTVIITGGGADAVLGLLRHSVEYQPNLVLHGLAAWVRGVP